MTGDKLEYLNDLYCGIATTYTATGRASFTDSPEYKQAQCPAPSPVPSPEYGSLIWYPP